MNLSLPQQLTIAKFLAEHFAGVRSGTLNPAAVEEMTVSERLAVKFAGRLTAWVTLPKSARRASVKDKSAFLAWVKKNLPDEIVTVEAVREGTQRQLLDHAKAGGWPNPETGEREPIPGVEVKDGDLVPHVELEDDAAAAIAAAWQAGDIDLGGMLALPGPAPEAKEAAG